MINTDISLNKSLKRNSQIKKILLNVKNIFKSLIRINQKKLTIIIPAFVSLAFLIYLLSFRPL